MTKLAVSTALPVAGVVKMRRNATQRDSWATLDVASWIDISIDLILAARWLEVEVG